MTRSEQNNATDDTRICPKCEAAYSGDLERCPVDGARLLFLRDEPDRFLGRTLDGRFRIDARLGGGAMGTVYRAWQISVQREVAVKIMNPRMGATAMGVRRFLREARLASKLSQPNTVSVLDFGQTREGDLFLVMELLHGRTLFDVLRDEGRFDVERTVRVGAQLCDALEAAHGEAIVHRDLKPSNILVLDSPHGRDMIKVLDFGLAKSIEGDETEATMTGQVVGTPRYIAPELWLGGEATARSDLYALGMILGEMALGEPMFRTPRGAAQLAERIADVRVQLPAALGPPLRPLVERLLAPEPRDRPHSAASVRAQLVECLGAGSSVLSAWSTSEALDSTPSATEELGAAGDQSATTTVDARPPRAARRARRRVPAVLAMVVGVAAMVAAVVYVSDRAGSGSQSKGGEGPPVEDTMAGAERPDEALAPAPDASSAVEGMTADAAVVEAQTVAPRPDSVELDLRSTPRATVEVDGRGVGRTPVKVRVPRTDREIEVSFKRRGSRTVRKTVIPDRDHAIDVSLPKKPRRSKPDKPKYPF